MAKKGISVNGQRNHSKLMKRIPLHYQKKLSNISNGAINMTLITGAYKNKIRTLLKNNVTLAVNLQNDRSKKEELLEESKANANIIMFSRLKLASLSDNLKKVVTDLDETLALLQMHSSVSCTKFTPKHTMSREEFKDTVKDVLMDSIPEEPESPMQKSDETNMAYLDKKQSEEVSPEFQVDMPKKKHKPPDKSANSVKKLRPGNLNKKNSTHNSDKIDMNTENYDESYKYSKTTAPAKNFAENSPLKKAATQFKKLSSKKKNFTSEVNETKAKLETSKKCSKITKNTVLDEEKSVECFHKDKNFKQKSSPLKITPLQSKLCNDIIQIYDDIQVPENNRKKKNNSLGSSCKPKNSVSSSKLFGNIVNNTSIISDCEKENSPYKRQKLYCEKGNSPYKGQKLSTRKLKSLGEFEVAPNITKRASSRSSALQCLSSKINIENFKNNEGKCKTFPLDDLTAIQEVPVNKSPEGYDTSKSYLQDISLHQQEMVRNLAENTFLVTAEVHKNPEPLTKQEKTHKMKLPKSEVCNLKEPIVLVTDIFQPGKSFCKSISYPACDELNTIPLELQLLEHCSSLKMIPEESNHSQDNSANNGFDQTEEKVPEIKLKNTEPSLSVEGEFIEQPLCQVKRAFRKRSASINYKELPSNIKLRR